MNTNQLSFKKFLAVQIITITSLQGMEQKLAKMPYHPLVQQKTNIAINKKQPLKDIKNLIPGLKVLPKEIVENYVLPYVGLQGINNYVWARSLKIAKTYIAHKAAISSVQYSPDDRFLLTTHHDNVVCLLNAQSGNKERTFQYSGLSHVQFTPDSLKIGICGGNDAGILDIRRNVYTQLLGHTDAIRTIRFNDDGNQTITVSDDWSFRIWDTDSGKELQKCFFDVEVPYPLNYANCKDASFVPQKNNIIVVLSDYTIRIFDRNSLNEIGRRHFHGAFYSLHKLCTQHPYNNRMLIIERYNRPFCYNLASGQVRPLYLQPMQHPKALYFNQNGTTLFEYHSKNPALFDTASMQRICTLKSDKKEQICAANFNNRGNEIIIGDEDGKICIWQKNVTLNQDQATLLLALEDYKVKNSVATFKGFCNFCDIDAGTLKTILNSFDDETQNIIQKGYPFVINNFKTTSLGAYLASCMRYITCNCCQCYMLDPMWP